MPSTKANPKQLGFTTFETVATNRVAVPLIAALKEQLGWSAGTRLLVHIEDGVVLVRARKDVARAYRGSASGQGPSVDEFLTERRAEAKREGW